MTPEVFRTIAITATMIGVFVILPIVVLMLEHQRKMATIIRGEKSEPSEFLRAFSGSSQSGEAASALEARVQALEEEVRELRSRREATRELVAGDF